MYIRVDRDLFVDRSCLFMLLRSGPGMNRLHTVLVLSKLKKINATAPQPQRNVLKYFSKFKNIAHSLEPGETPRHSASHQAPNYVQRS